MHRIAKRTLTTSADIDVTAICQAAGVSYLPRYESSEKVAYSCNVYGWTGSLRRGERSGALYAVTDYGNDCHTYSPRDVERLGSRELAVIDDLARVEVIQSRRDTGRAVVAYVARDGRRFTVSCTDSGHEWTVCG